MILNQMAYLLIFLLMITIIQIQGMNFPAFTNVQWDNSKMEQLKTTLSNLPKTVKGSLKFSDFKQQNNKEYLHKYQQQFRALIYKTNKEKIDLNNKNPNRSFNTTINKFADLTAKQFSAKYTSTFSSDVQIQIYAQTIVQNNFNFKMGSLIGQRTTPNSSSGNQNGFFPKIVSNGLSFNIKNYAKNKMQDQLTIKNSLLTQQNPQFQNLVNAMQNGNFYEENSDFNAIKKQAKQRQNLKINQNSMNPFLPQGINLQNNLKTQLELAMLQSKQNFNNQNKANGLESTIFSKEKKSDEFNSTKGFILSTKLDSGINSLPQSNLNHIKSMNNLNSMNNMNNIEMQKNFNILNNMGASRLRFLQNDAHYDWSKYMGPVRSQGNCGACYALATTDVLASLYSINKFKIGIPPLSAQQMIDCSDNGLTDGCNGGFIEGAYAFLQNNGLTTEKEYPYASMLSGTPGKCKSITRNIYKLSSFQNIQSGDCKAVIKNLSYGPLSIGIAGYRLQFYSNGVFDDCNTFIDHAVALVGYRSGVGWKIKNSWGQDWGINGYAWIAQQNTCGICNNAFSATV